MLSSRRVVRKHVPPAAQSAAMEWRRTNRCHLSQMPDEAVVWVLTSEQWAHIRTVLHWIGTLRVNFHLRHQYRQSYRDLYRAVCAMERNLVAMDPVTFKADQLLVQLLVKAWRECWLLPQVREASELRQQVAKDRAARSKGAKSQQERYDQALLARRELVERVLKDHKRLGRDSQVTATRDDPRLADVRHAIDLKRLERLFGASVVKGTRGPRPKKNP